VCCAEDDRRCVCCDEDGHRSVCLQINHMVNYDGRVILFRNAGVTDLEGLGQVRTIAHRLSGSKGKQNLFR
jgi:hypothetical protein